MALHSLKEHTVFAWNKLRQHKFIANTSAYVSGSILQNAARFLLVPLWARFLTPEDYGITGTLAVYVGMLTTLLGMGLYGAVVRHYYDYLDDLDQCKRYITSVMSFQAFFAGTIIALLLLFGDTLWAKFTANIIPFFPYVPLVLFTLYLDLLAQIPLALYRAKQEARKFVYFQYGRFFLLVVCDLVLIVGLRLGAYGILLASLISSTVTTFIALYFAYRNWFVKKFSWSYVHDALNFGLPLVPHAVAAWMLKSVDRLVLERYISLGEIGLYNLGYSFGLVMQHLVAGINQAWSPYYYELMKRETHPESRIVQVVSLYLVIVGSISLLGILFAGEAIYLLFPARFYGAVPYIAPIFLGYQMLGLYYFAGMPLFYFKRTKILPLLTIMASVFNLVLNLVFVPLYGAVAAAWATAAGYALLLIVIYVVGQRWQRIEYPLFRYASLIAVLTFSAFLVSHLNIFSLSGIVIKLSVITLYAMLAYVWFLKQYTGKLRFFRNLWF